MRTVTSFLPIALLAVCCLTSGCATLNWKWKGREEAENKLSSQLSFARLTERYGQPQQARAIYEAILRDNPNQPVAHHRLAIIAASEPDVARAETHFQQSLAAGEPSAELLRDYGYLLYVQDRLPEAEQTTLQSLQRDPQNKAAHNNLGLILGEQGRFPEALDAFRKAGSEAESQANIAYVHALMGNLPVAEQHYHQALEIDPNLRQAAEGLVQIAEFRKQQESTAKRERMAADRLASEAPFAHSHPSQAVEPGRIRTGQPGPPQMVQSLPIDSPQPGPLTTTQRGLNHVRPTAGVGLPPQPPHAASAAARSPRGVTPIQPGYSPATMNSRSRHPSSPPGAYATAPRSQAAERSFSDPQRPAGLPTSGIMPASYDQPANSRSSRSVPTPPSSTGMRSAQNAPPTRPSATIPSATVTMPGTDSPPAAWSQATPWQAPTWSAPPQPQR
jgi:Tfp pilus assembly protein PilF